MSSAITCTPSGGDPSYTISTVPYTPSYVDATPHWSITDILPMCLAIVCAAFVISFIAYQTRVANETETREVNAKQKHAMDKGLVQEQDAGGQDWHWSKPKR